MHCNYRNARKPMTTNLTKTTTRRNYKAAHEFCQYDFAFQFYVRVWGGDYSKYGSILDSNICHTNYLY